MIVANSVVAVLVSIACSTDGSDQTADPIEAISTEFGYVKVDHRDVQAAVVEGRAAKLAAEKILSLPNVSFALVEEDCTDARWAASVDGHVTYVWTFPNSPRLQAPRPPTHVLRHEIGHDLFARHLVPRTSDHQYGTDAPDWLDEMAAIAFEGDQQRLNRRRVMSRSADASLMPLPELLSIVHPEFETVTSASLGTNFDVSLPSSKDTIRYYATIGALYDFLVERTGTEAIVAELAAAFRNGERLDNWILARTGHGNHGSIEDLDAEFMAWFAADERKVEDVRL